MNLEMLQKATAATAATAATVNREKVDFPPAAGDARDKKSEKK